ncbi:hypothetical protein Q3G72_016671 [Acer saccharum]|nr:hypothetical protein Q3G72_016671 [Acer saccharum]
MLLVSRETNMLAKILLSLGYVLGLALIHPNYAQDSPENFLNVHNEARLEVGVRKLTWNITVLNFESPLPILPCKMPVPNYDVPTAAAICSGSGQALMSLIVPR